MLHSYKHLVALPDLYSKSNCWHFYMFTWQLGRLNCDTMILRWLAYVPSYVMAIVFLDITRLAGYSLMFRLIRGHP